VYGDGSKSVVNKFVRAIKSGKIIKVYGNTVRDYIHVDDIVLAILRLIEAKQAPKLVHIGTGRGVSLHKLVSMIQHETGEKARVVHFKPLKEIQVSECSDLSFGFYKTTLERGIRRLIK
jgi:nucleoside-diphosphate-sugar epimerase